jgi:hypothetical protein
MPDNTITTHCDAVPNQQPLTTNHVIRDKPSSTPRLHAPPRRAGDNRAPENTDGLTGISDEPVGVRIAAQASSRTFRPIKRELGSTFLGKDQFLGVRMSGFRSPWVCSEIHARPDVTGRGCGLDRYPESKETVPEVRLETETPRGPA